MARAHGARAQMALAFETVYGTAPATGFRTVPFASTTLGRSKQRDGQTFGHHHWIDLLRPRV